MRDRQVSLFGGGAVDIDVLQALRDVLALLEACVLLSSLDLLLLRFLEDLFERGRRRQVLLVCEDDWVRVVIRRRLLSLQLLSTQLVVGNFTLCVIDRMAV